MVFMPPGSAKSTYSSILFPPYYLGRHPDHLILGASHTAELAERFGRRVRNIVDSRPYHHLFEFGLSGDSRAAGRWETERGGEYYGVGVGGSITGRRADGAIVDDPVKGHEEADSETARAKMREWWKHDFWTRLKPDAWIILIMTRWHEADLAGWLLEEQASGGEKWEVLSLPAVAKAHDPLGRKAGELLWPEWFTPAMMAQARRDSRAWSALYQQEPSAEGGNILKREWWKPWPGKVDCELIVHSYDTAFSEKDSADYSARTTWGVFHPTEGGAPCALLLEAWRGRVGLPQLVAEAQKFFVDEVFAADYVLVENKASGISFGQYLHQSGIPVSYYDPGRADKVVRAHAAAPMLESGRVYARWSKAREDFHPSVLPAIAECTSFPNAPHMDWTDTVTQILIRLRRGGLIAHPSEPIEDEVDPAPVRSLYG